MKRTNAIKVGVSPIISGRPIKGPADKLLHGLRYEVSAFGVASLYKDFLDTFIIDVSDDSERERIENLGIKVKVTNIFMGSLKDKVN